VKTDTTGTPTEYLLKPFSHFTLGEAHISTMDIKLYATEDAQIAAYKASKITAMAGVTANRVAALNIPIAETLTTALPRVFAVFLNQSQATVFLDAGVRKALDVGLDKSAIINSALAGYGTPLDGPIPPGVMANNVSSAVSDTAAASSSAIVSAARTILTKDGWSLSSSTGFFVKGKQQLAFSLSTADTPELVASANAVAEQWKALGANVTVKVFSSGSINTSVIRPRSYDSLLFGEVVGRTLDLFAFWHSSQRADPGLNLALYTNAKADTLLSEARAEVDRTARETDYVSFAKIVTDDHPAVFLYAPDFIYIIPAKLKGVALGALTTPSDRFLNVYQWHIETKNVWSIFSAH
jgi:peptide/nickel transport system substrate-binding protein